MRADKKKLKLYLTNHRLISKESVKEENHSIKRSSYRFEKKDDDDMNVDSQARERITLYPHQQRLGFLQASTPTKKTDSSFKKRTFNET